MTPTEREFDMSEDEATHTEAGHCDRCKVEVPDTGALLNDWLLAGEAGDLYEQELVCPCCVTGQDKAAHAEELSIAAERFRKKASEFETKAEAMRADLVQFEEDDDSVFEDETGAFEEDVIR